MGAVKAKCTKVADEWLARQRSSPLMAQRESQCLKKQILLCEQSKAILQQLTVISALQQRPTRTTRRCLQRGRMGGLTGWLGRLATTSQAPSMFAVMVSSKGGV